MGAFVLTEEINDYNQHGRYLVAIFHEKPTSEQLGKLLGYKPDYFDCLISNGFQLNGHDNYQLEWLEEGVIFK